MYRIAPLLGILCVASTALAAPAEWAPSAAEELLISQLSLRDASPPCAEMEATLPDAAASLRAVVAHVSMPPWVPMRAADCLIAGHAAASRAELTAWVTLPELKGLGLLALGRLDVMPADVAVEVATAAIARGPDPAAARVRVARSTNPAIASLAVVKQ